MSPPPLPVCAEPRPQSARRGEHGQGRGRPAVPHSAAHEPDTGPRDQQR